MKEITQILPAVALRALVVMPDMIVHFDVNRGKSVQAIEDAMLHDQQLLLVAQRDVLIDEPGLDDVYEYGTVAIVKQVVKLPKGMLRVLVEGVQRAKIIDFEPREDMLEAEIIPLEEETILGMDGEHREAMVESLKELLTMYGESSANFSRDLMMQLSSVTELEKLIDQIAINFPVTWDKRQQLLETITYRERFDLLCYMLAREVNIMEIRAEIEQNIKAHIDKNQRDYILREQMKVIREELGEDGTQSEIKKFKKQTEKLRAPREVKEKLKEEIRRLEHTGNNPSEGGVIRGYIETLLGLPWDKTSRDNRDLKKARQTLENEHYGLEKVKERILEYLAVRLATKKGEAPILCLVGPPGTGKTSISKSVANALSKTFVRISLGGVRDEAEIRGHRRTYIGAMPGRIAQGLHQAGVKNPLMLLDEIDKTSSDYKGDISSALLEVLDPQENHAFSDHYVELPIDLSEVLFIATANDVQAIPKPLLDRMEVIEITSYTENEKVHIAREHLIPRQIKSNGLKKNSLTIDDEALDEIIGGHTREAGVRSLDRQIGQICRKSALRIQENEETPIHVTKENLEDFLGRAHFRVTMANDQPEIGIVRGLAWTSVGGDTLQIEVNIMPGKGEFMLTGQLGDVMKESAQTGISYIRSVAEQYQIAPEFFRENDIHIHIPEGAVPKDGPSAGITMATAMLSAITGTPVRSDVAMTGEITLRGRVLPIGGLKEKLLAAKKAGIKTVLVPIKNQPDVEEMDQEIKDGLEILFMTNMQEVIEQAFVGKKKRRTRKAAK